MRKADGQLLTGIDVNILKEDRIRENWTFVAERHCERADPAPETGGGIDPAILAGLCQRWIQLRNGRAELAMDVATEDFALFSGVDPVSDAHGPSELAKLVERQAETDDRPPSRSTGSPSSTPRKGAWRSSGRPKPGRLVPPSAESTS